LRGALGKIAKFTLQIVKRTDKAKGFEVLPRRWVVERTFAWLGRCRRSAKDWEKSIASAEAWMLITHIRFLLEGSQGTMFIELFSSQSLSSTLYIMHRARR
jgi:transposase